MKPTVYLDTSVPNFLFADDSPQLKEITIEFFDVFIKPGIYKTYVSDFVVQEINKTTNQKRRSELLNVLIDYPVELLVLPDLSEIDRLADLYVFERVIPASKRFDALHIAVAVISKLDFLVSWNYKHLANIGRERGVLAVNNRHNYFHPLRIITPLELIDYGNTNLKSPT